MPTVPPTITGKLSDKEKDSLALCLVSRKTEKKYKNDTKPCLWLSKINIIENLDFIQQCTLIK